MMGKTTSIVVNGFPQDEATRSDCSERNLEDSRIMSIEKSAEGIKPHFEDREYH
jgi:hypothetical protein